MKEPSNTTHPIYTIDPRTPRQIYMDLHGITPSSIVQCYLCHEQHLMAEMTVHHLIGKEICYKFPWLRHLVTDPANLIPLDWPCHETYFNQHTISRLQHKLAAAQLELRELKGEDN